MRRGSATSDAFTPSKYRLPSGIPSLNTCSMTISAPLNPSGSNMKAKMKTKIRFPWICANTGGQPETDRFLHSLPELPGPALKFLFLPHFAAMRALLLLLFLFVVRSVRSSNEGATTAHPVPQHGLRKGKKYHGDNMAAPATTTAAALHKSVIASDNSSSIGGKVKNLVFASLTTVPWRMSQTSEIKQTIDSLLAIQKIDRIYINIPWTYGVRTKSATNVSVPDLLLAYNKDTNGRVRVNRCDDYGPATKLLPLLLLADDELPTGAAIIAFDDDRIYTQGAVDALLAEASRHPSDVIAIAAW